MKKWSGVSLIEILMIIVVIAVLGMIFLPVTLNHPEKARVTTCISNQKQINICLAMYAQDHKETLPLSSKVWTALGADIAKIKCPAKKEFHTNYLYNNNLSGINIDKLVKTANPSTIMMTVDGTTTIGQRRTIENIYYTPNDVEYRHGKNTVLSHLDGSVIAVKSVTEPESWDKVGIINSSNDKVKKK